VPSDFQPPKRFVLGITPNSPSALAVPAVEARPDQPPDAGPFLRVCAGMEEPRRMNPQAGGAS
jgi:hypothetical protein